MEQGGKKEKKEKARPWEKEECGAISTLKEEQGITYGETVFVGFGERNFVS